MSKVEGAALYETWRNERENDSTISYLSIESDTNGEIYEGRMDCYEHSEVGGPFGFTWRAKRTRDANDLEITPITRRDVDPGLLATQFSHSEKFDVKLKAYIARKIRAFEYQRDYIAQAVRELESCQE